MRSGEMRPSATSCRMMAMARAAVSGALSAISSMSTPASSAFSIAMAGG